MVNKNFFFKLLLLICVEIAFAFFFTPAFNVLSFKFWFFIVLPPVLWFWNICPSETKLYKIASAILILLAILLVSSGLMFIISSGTSSEVHSQIAKISNDGVFEDSVIEITSPNDIPTIDKESAITLASNLISSNQQYFETYKLGTECNLIYYKESYYRILPLEYIDPLNFGGVPGYILVNIYNGETNFIKLENNNTIKYSPSSIFDKDLSRYIRFKYPTELFGDENFEIDDNGHPYYIVPTLKSTTFSVNYVYGALVVDAVTGDIQKYTLANLPEWIENVYDVERLMTEAKWHIDFNVGPSNWLMRSAENTPATRYHNGSEYYVFGKNGEIYVYTGVTIGPSYMNNIAFLLGNLRTGELTYYSDYGISENNAQMAAQNLFLENQYVPSRVLLLNIEGNPVYYLTFKNHLEHPEQYAFVNKNKPSVFCVTGESVDDALKNYYKMLGIKYPYSIEYDEST